MTSISTNNQSGSVHVVLLSLLIFLVVGVLGLFYWNNFIVPQAGNGSLASNSEHESPSIREGFVTILIVNNADEDNAPIANATIGLKIWDDGDNYSESCPADKDPMHALELKTDDQGILRIPNDKVAGHSCISVSDIKPRPHGPWHVDDLTGVKANTSHVVVADGSAVDN